MQTQKDHVHAYQFMVERMTSALVHGDPASQAPPPRKVVTAIVGGVVLALLVAAGFGVYGLLKPGGNEAWKRAGVIIVEKETGTRYVLRDGLLRPVANHASALLAQGTGAKVETVSRESMAGARRGAPLGILGAPDPVPRAQDLVGGPVYACASGINGNTTLVFGTGGRDVSTLPEGRYALLRDRAGNRYLVLGGAVHLLADATVPIALGLPAGSEPVVSDGWLATVPRGMPFGPPVVDGTGEPGPSVAGRPQRVGQLYRQRAEQVVTGSYVLSRDGLTAVDDTDFALLAAQPDAPKPVDLAPSDVSAAPKSAVPSLLHRLPDLVHLSPADLDGVALCARHQGSEAIVVAVRGVPRGPEAVPAAVVLPSGAAVLAEQTPVPKGQQPRRFLITEQGLAFEVADDESLAALGLRGAAALPVPATVLALVGPGPVLSRAALAAEKG